MSSSSSSNSQAVRQLYLTSSVSLAASTGGSTRDQVPGTLYDACAKHANVLTASDSSEGNNPSQMALVHNLSLLKQADVLVAECSSADTAVGMEVAYALETVRIPTLCLFNPQESQDGLCELVADHTSPFLTTKQYENASDMEAIIDAFLAPKVERGRVFTIEGGDGAGKETQTAMLVAALRKRGYPAQTLDFPHDASQFGALIRDILAGNKGTIKEVDPLLFASLYSINRADNARLLEHWLSTGHNVVLDRYMESNWGHQASKMESDEDKHAMVERLRKFEVNWLGLPASHRVVYLDLPHDYALRAMQSRDELDMHEKAGNAYKEAVRSTFVWCSEQYDTWRVQPCLSEDEQTRLTVDEVHAQIWDAWKDEFVNGGDSE